MQNILGRFIGFDRLLGPALVRVVYYTGLVGIVLFVTAAGFAGLMTLASDFVRGLVMLLGAIVVGAAMLVYWRFVCELFMIAFKAFERLGEIRDALNAGVNPGAPRPPPDFSQF